MKATEKYFLAVLFIVLYKVVLTFESVDEILKCDHLMKATEQYFPVVLFTMLYKVILTFESVGKILKDPIGTYRDALRIVYFDSTGHGPRSFERKNNSLSSRGRNEH